MGGLQRKGKKRPGLRGSLALGLLISAALGTAPVSLAAGRRASPTPNPKAAAKLAQNKRAPRPNVNRYQRRQPLKPQKTWYTYFNGPPHYQPLPEPSFDPASSIPPRPEDYRWHLSTARLSGSDQKKGGVPIFRYDDYTIGKIVINGQRPDGLEVLPTGIHARNGLQYYRVRTLGAGGGEEFWVAGYYLKVSLKPPSQPSPK